MMPRLLQFAIAQALKNTHPKWRLHAVGSNGSRVLGSAGNKARQHYSPVGTIEPENLGYCAEHRLLKQCQPSIVYVARVTVGGRVGLARPCERCWEELHNANVRKVVYTTTEGWEWQKLSSPTPAMILSGSLL